MDKSLPEKMLMIAKRDALPNDHELVMKAKAFSDACQGYLTEPQTCSAKKFLGCWARAKKAYCQYTGEPLL